MEDNSIKLFESKRIRTAWDEQQEKWYFSVVDVVATLTDSVDATAYWRKLKKRLKEEGNETVTNCHTLTIRNLLCLLTKINPKKSKTNTRLWKEK